MLKLKRQGYTDFKRPPSNQETEITGTEYLPSNSRLTSLLVRLTFPRDVPAALPGFP